MKTTNSFLKLLFLILFFSQFVSYGMVSFEDNKLESQDEKIYVNQDQILILDQGILIQDQENQFFIHNLNYDINGYYFFRSDAYECGGACPKGHQIWCKRCRGCSEWGCPFACKCT